MLVKFLNRTITDCYHCPFRYISILVSGWVPADGTDQDALVRAVVKDMGYIPIKIITGDGPESMNRDLFTYIHIYIYMYL